MRSITKQGNGGYHLTQSHATPPTTSDQATSRWGGFGYKTQVTGFLVYEQYGLCAYSEIRPDRASIATHIEHVEPKSKNPARTFDYTNLVLSALSNADLKTLNATDVFGGHAKLGQYDSVQFISCLQPGYANHFAYLSNGKVEPAINLNAIDAAKVQYTINLLNLNCPYLVSQRKNWLDELDELIDKHLQNNQSLEHLAAVDLTPTNHTLSQFFTATHQRFGRIAEHLLATQCPELV